MERIQSIKFVLLATLATLFVATVVVGCGSDAMVKEDPAVAARRLESGKSLRSYFDKSQGNYDALSDADKQAVIAITKSEANARTAFGHMVGGTPNGGGGGLPPSGSSATGG